MLFIEAVAQRLEYRRRATIGISSGKRWIASALQLATHRSEMIVHEENA